MALLNVSIVTPEGAAYSGEASAVTAPGALGSFGVLVRHAPLVAALQPGVFKVQEPSGARYFVTDQGVLQVNNDRVIILVDHALAAADPAEARERLLDTQRSGRWPAESGR